MIDVAAEGCRTRVSASAISAPILTMARSVEDAVSAGIAALTRIQAADGSFPLLTHSGSNPWVPCGRLFSTAYVMLGAGGLLARDNIDRAVSFIESQRRADGLWEYDPELRLPPDSDSTACSLAAIVLHGDPSSVQGAAHLLRSFWRPPGGPFRTWRAPGMWSLPERDDAVVNCNVLFALRLLGSPATIEEQSAVLQLLRRSENGSRYYCAPSTIAHAARRVGLDLDALPPVAAARPAGDDLLGCVQWLCGMPSPDVKLIGAVLAAQDTDGSWPVRPWVTAIANPKPIWESAAITTSLALEALVRHSRLPNRSIPIA